MNNPQRNAEFIARYALIHTKGIGPVLLNKLLQHFPSASDIYNLPKSDLKEIINQNTIINSIVGKRYFTEAEQELNWMEQNQVGFLFTTDNNYPYLLKNIPDAPSIVYYKGKIHWNDRHNISVVGTRSANHYGIKSTEYIVKALSEFPCAIVSGLALGIDTVSHSTALANDLPTFAVLAHGLDRIYPAKNKNLAEQIIQTGALITEYSTQDKFNRENFLQRNRIIAGLSETTIITQSKFGGGAMTTARYAFAYDRELYAVPGRMTDLISQGCNFLIKNLQAKLLLDPQEIYQWFGKEEPKQKELFIELNDKERKLVEQIKKAERIQIDDLAYQLEMPTFEIMPILLELEFKEVVISLPGKFYSIR